MAKFFHAYGFNEETAKGAADKAVESALRRVADAMIVLNRAA